MLRFIAAQDQSVLLAERPDLSELLIGGFILAHAAAVATIGVYDRTGRKR